ncbi:hypothetical protein GIB67_023540 [Kingdonia uniflora]|uniref:Uncharacterized protein n=1 Tax=Kingdonia uniflora TaxID=39325 RepID=A0A7J7PA15_9MAGN|nr:hypothetical protein GIB67_023540 [Kingdonia uniflora]
MGRGKEEPLLDIEREADINVINSFAQFMNETMRENKKFWHIAAPAIFTLVTQYSLGAITQVYAGHLTALELDAISTQNSHSRTCFQNHGISSALETLCGQAFGTKKLHMLGVYMQRSWIIFNIICLVLLPIYIWATPILRFFGQNQEIAELTGKFAVYTIPQIFVYSFIITIQKFLQSQRKVMAMAWVSGVALVFHTFLSWLLIVQFQLGLAGAAVMVAYGVGLEFWYPMFILVLAGCLKNSQIAVTAISICNNLNGWVFMIFLGINAEIRKTKGCQVVHTTGGAIIVSVALGAGWQSLGAYVTLGSYYLVGIPLEFLFGSKLERREEDNLLDYVVKGIWIGMGLKIVILTGITLGTNWNKETSLAASPIRKWKGPVDSPVKSKDGYFSRAWGEQDDGFPNLIRWPDCDFPCSS